MRSGLSGYAPSVRESLFYGSPFIFSCFQPISFIYNLIDKKYLETHHQVLSEGWNYLPTLEEDPIARYTVTSHSSDPGRQHIPESHHPAVTSCGSALTSC